VQRPGACGKEKPVRVSRDRALSRRLIPKHDKLCKVGTTFRVPTAHIPEVTLWMGHLAHEAGQSYQGGLGWRDRLTGTPCWDCAEKEICSCCVGTRYREKFLFIPRTRISFRNQAAHVSISTNSCEQWKEKLCVNKASSDNCVTWLDLEHDKHIFHSSVWSEEQAASGLANNSCLQRQHRMHIRT
jgi:hypothetical protein